MKKIFVSLFIGALLGAAGGVALGIFLYPYIYLSDVVAKGKLAGAAHKTIIATGTFRNANISEPIRSGKSGVMMYSDAVHLNADFATGILSHVKPSDPIRSGKGGVTMYNDAVHLHADFEVSPGPAYHVYLVPLDTVTLATAVDKTMYVDLGPLRAFKGSQVYEIPSGMDLKKYPSVVIWCEQFNALISPAKLEFR